MDYLPKNHNKFLFPVPAGAIYGSFCKAENVIFHVVSDKKPGQESKGSFGFRPWYFYIMKTDVHSREEACCCGSEYWSKFGKEIWGYVKNEDSVCGRRGSAKEDDAEKI